MDNYELMNNSYNCPICNNDLKIQDREIYLGFSGVHGPCQLFLCDNAIVKQPTHYYSHIVDLKNPEVVSEVSFNLNLTNKSFIITINFLHNKTEIMSITLDNTIIENFSITPDFPELKSFKNKIKTYLIFS
jgi:hypothetical protein